MIATAAILAFTASCDSPARPGGRGNLTAVITSPNGDEGAAVLDVNGTVDAFVGSSDVSVYTTPAPSGTRVVLVRMTPGALSVTLTVPDISRPPTISIVEIADGADHLRASLAGYTVAVR